MPFKSKTTGDLAVLHPWPTYLKRHKSLDSAKADGITKKVTESMAGSEQPFGVVEEIGFQRLMVSIEPCSTILSSWHFSDVWLDVNIYMAKKFKVGHLCEI